MKYGLPFLLLLASLTSPAQTSKIKNYVADQKNQHRWLQQYSELLAIPNVLGDSVNIQRNANWLKDFLTKAGVKTHLLQSGKTGSAPVVYGEVITPGAATTLAFYAHYDGQPVNPKQWSEGLSPFSPVLLSTLR